MPTIRVRIADRDFLETRREQSPTINIDMLDMAGMEFEIEKRLTPEGWYSIDSWKWHPDWIEILEDNTAPAPRLTLPPLTRYDIDDFNVFLATKEMPLELEHFTIAGPSMVQTRVYDINHYQFRLETRNETGFYVKFKGSVEYNISDYFTRFTFGDTIRSLRDRIHEPSVVRVVQTLSYAFFEFGEKIIQKQLFRSPYDLYSVQKSESLFGSGNSFPIGYEIWKYATLQKIYNFVRKAVQTLSLDVEVLDIGVSLAYHTVKRDDLVIIDANTHFIKFVSRTDMDTHFPYIPYKKDDILGFYYATIKEPIEMFLAARWPDVGNERVLQMPDYDKDLFPLLTSLVYGSTHRLAQYPMGYLLGHKWYTKAAYEAEITKFDKLKKFNIELKGNKFYYTPTGRYMFNEPDTADFIAEYDHEPDINFFGDMGDLHLGVELEIDKGGENHFHAGLVMLPMGWNHVYAMHDGSLNNGFEIATMPMTLAYAESIRSNFADMVGVATHLGYQSHNTSTCGLHIHFDRHFFGNTRSTQNIKAGYLALIMERNWEKFVEFSRRNYDRLDQWAAKKDLIADVYADDTDNDLRDKFTDKYMQGDKYVALNTNHSNTFELRIFRGTLKLETLFATMQFVDNLVRVAKDCPSLARAQQITFADIINYNPHKDLVDYVDSRGILTRNYIEYKGD